MTLTSDPAHRAASGDFSGLEVVVTGGTGGLGRAVVSLLLDAGATCWIPSVDPRLLEGLPFASHPSAHIVEGVDLLDEGSVSAFFARPTSLWASIHLVGGFAMAPFSDTTGADMKRMFDLNVMTAFHCSRAAVGRMREGHGGRIVNVAARPALTPTAGMTAYAVSKAALVSLTTSLAEELKRDAIFVNAIAPSIMDTPDNRRAMPNADHSRWPKTEDVARSIAYLASRENALTSGLVMPVYGLA
jgi:NAD(P)-dependent dehydrogenase (short-subunit alcohol dehydrogenase family)